MVSIWTVGIGQMVVVWFGIYSCIICFRRYVSGFVCVWENVIVWVGVVFKPAWMGKYYRGWSWYTIQYV